MQAACAEVGDDIVEDLRRREGIQEVCFCRRAFPECVAGCGAGKTSGDEPGICSSCSRKRWSLARSGPLAMAPGVAKTSNDTAAPHAYLGPKFDRHAIRDVLENSKNRYTFSNTEERKLDVGAQLLQAGKIVGWFQGAAEFGPRALGNRSVLASPWAAYVKENLNDFIKHREWFRPFAISVPEEDCERYFEASPQCRFMNSVGTVRPGTECLPESFPAAEPPSTAAYCRAAQQSLLSGLC